VLVLGLFYLLDAQYKRPLKKRCPDIIGPGVWGVPQIYKVPQDWGIRGLSETPSAVSISIISHSKKSLYHVDMTSRMVTDVNGSRQVTLT